MPIAERTLVKSVPELWQVLDEEDRMRRWMAEFTGVPGDAEIRVVRRDHERRLAWEPARNPAASGRAAEHVAGMIEVSLEEKGWGTQVRLSAEPFASPDDLERALDELGTAHKRPFSR